MSTSKYHAAIDNGTSGTLAVLHPHNEPFFVKTPIKTELSYTKKKQFITRVDVPAFKDMMLNVLDPKHTRMILERPGINPGRFKTTLSAMRSLEATLIILEELGVAYSYIDSREWQKAMLPSGLKGPELKKASLQVGKRLFPQVSINHSDYDGLLMAEYARRMNL